jgi:hypothetical protein
MSKAENFQVEKKLIIIQTSFTFALLTDAG